MKPKWILLLCFRYKCHPQSNNGFLRVLIWRKILFNKPSQCPLVLNRSVLMKIFQHFSNTRSLHALSNDKCVNRDLISLTWINKFMWDYLLCSNCCKVLLPHWETLPYCKVWSDPIVFDACCSNWEKFISFLLRCCWSLARGFSPCPVACHCVMMPQAAVACSQFIWCRNLQLFQGQAADLLLWIFCLKWNVCFLQFWTDNYLKWNVSEYPGVNSMRFPSNLIWKPDILLYNR